MFRNLFRSRRNNSERQTENRRSKQRLQARRRQNMGFETLENRMVLTLGDPLGVIDGINGGSNPPDTVMDVGPNHVIQMVNATSYQVFDKHGNSLTTALSFGALFPAASPISANLGDPIVVYDHLADRWVLSQFGRNADTTGGYLGFAISQSPDPVGGIDGIANNGDEWFTYTYDTTDFPDYPKIGVSQDAYYVTTYESPNLGIYAFDRNMMLAGNAGTFLKTTISDLTPSAGYRDTRILPADLDGVSPPPGTPGFFLRTVDDNQDTSDARDRIEIWSAVPDFVGGTMTFTLIEDLDAGDGLNAFDTMLGNRNGQGIRDMIPQPGTIDTIDSLSNRPMMQLKLRNFGTHLALVVNQTIDQQNLVQAQTGYNPVDEVAGLRWYELRSTNNGVDWAIQQQGDFAPQIAGLSADNQILHRWMGSTAFDADGNIAIAYSVTNSDNANPIFPGIRYAARLATDPLGQLSQGEQIIFNGTTFQGNADAFVDPQRWGDYAALSIDPTDDHKFWFSTNVANAVTKISAFFVDASPTGFNYEILPGDALYTLSIIADQLNSTRSDNIQLVVDPNDPTDVLVYLNGSGPIADYRVPAATLKQIIVNAGGGDDQLFVDFQNGNPIPAGNVRYIGGAGNDTISVIRDTDFTLSDTALSIATIGTIELDAVEIANLTAGSSANVFTVTTWSGIANIIASGGTDTLNVTKNNDFVASHGVVTTNDGMQVNFTGIEAVNLTGGNSGNRFEVTPSRRFLLRSSAACQPPARAMSFATTATIRTGSYWEPAAAVSRAIGKADVEYSGIELLEFPGTITLTVDANIVLLPGNTKNDGNTDTFVIVPDADPTLQLITINGKDLVKVGVTSLIDGPRLERHRSSSLPRDSQDAHRRHGQEQRSCQCRGDRAFGNARHQHGRRERLRRTRRECGRSQ